MLRKARGRIAGLALLALGTAAMIAPAAASAQGASGTTLTADKTATAHYTKTFNWTIDKSVSPDTWDLFRGDSGTSEYEIKVTKDDGTIAAWVDGQICVTNGGAQPTENLTIVDNLTVPPSNVVINSVNVDLSANPVLDPGESHCYPYTLTIPNPVPGANYKDTADITITNHSGHIGTPFGPNPSATSPLPLNPTAINGSINVDDTNGGTWLFSDDGSVTYTKKFSCDGDEGTHNNTATIRETGQSDSASVKVNCHELTLTKDAETSFDRTYAWDIDKSADQSSLTLSLGQTFLVNYSVVTSVTGYADSNHHVSGTISVANSTPIDATLNSVADVVSPNLNATVDCDVTFPYVLEAGETLVCTYDRDLPNATDRTNTATATLQNYDYDSEGVGTANGTTNFTGTAAVDFDDAAITELDACVDVSDTYAGDLGEVCLDDAPKTFTYSRTVGGYQTCGNHTVDNTAAFETSDTGATGDSSWTVAINVPCGGCTLTIGYWKTHSTYGPAAYDDAWALLPSGANTTFFLSGQTYYQVAWTPPAGNVYYVLAHQYIAAKINVLNGAATTPAVVSALASAQTLFNANTPAQAAGLKASAKATWTNLATTLANYNTGLIGPGHCSE